VVTRSRMVTTNASSKLFFIEAFSAQVWSGIFGLLLAQFVNTAMDTKFAPQLVADSAERASSWYKRVQECTLKNPILFRIRHAIFKSMYHMVGQTADVNTHNNGAKVRVMTLFALLMGIFLLTVFQASVTRQEYRNETPSGFRYV
jgi:hypothetical protein